MKITITIEIEPATTVTLPTEYESLAAFLEAHTAVAIEEILPEKSTDASIAVVVEADRA